MSAVTKVLGAACRMWIPLGVLTLMVTATTWPRPHAAHVDGSTVPERVVAARLTDIPSHNSLYRATLELTSGDSGWILRLRSASGTPIRNAHVEMDAWMPEHELFAHAILEATPYSSAGSYRVRALALDRPAWWNISVQISAAGRTDSLAFNAILR